jgi:hypothetical protein
VIKEHSPRDVFQGLDDPGIIAVFKELDDLSEEPFIIKCIVTNFRPPLEI